MPDREKSQILQTCESLRVKANLSLALVRHCGTVLRYSKELRSETGRVPKTFLLSIGIFEAAKRVTDNPQKVFQAAIGSSVTILKLDEFTEEEVITKSDDPKIYREVTLLWERTSLLEEQITDDVISRLGAIINAMLSEEQVFLSGEWEKYLEVATISNAFHFVSYIVSVVVNEHRQFGEFKEVMDKVNKILRIATDLNTLEKDIARNTSNVVLAYALSHQEGNVPNQYEDISPELIEQAKQELTQIVEDEIKTIDVVIQTRNLKRYETVRFAREVVNVFRSMS